VAKKITPKKPASKAAATKPPVTKQPAKKASAQKQPAAKATVSKSASAVKAKKTAKPKASTSAKAKPQSAKRTTGNVGSDSTASFTPYVVKRNEAYMNEPQRSHFKSILLNWRNQLMEEVDRTVSHMKDEAANYPDPSDRASQEEEFSLELRTRDRERKLIRKIEKTIDLIDQDDYGYCDTCGVEIGIRRLEARPTANQCIDCKTLDELKERQLHG
jgi:DnaK suppressor protein